jgi:hypothetical protein
MFLFQLLAFSTSIVTVNSRILPDNYDVVWNTPAPIANGSSSSMPVGGGDISLNVWAENGTVLFYVAKDGCFDENNSLLKLGRVRLSLEPNPFAVGMPFEQRLVLEDEYVQLTGWNSSMVKIWVDVYNPVIHVEISTPMPGQLIASFEDWRHKDHVMNISEQAQSSWSTAPNISATTFKDNVSFWHGNTVLMSHRNMNSRVFDTALRQQS